MATHVITGRDLNPRDVVALTRDGTHVALATEAEDAMDRAHAQAQEAARREPVYGRSTGVGANRGDVAEDPGHGGRLLASHATTGTTPYPSEVVRAAALVRVNQLARGGSGAPSTVATALVDRLNRGDLPELHRGGALGTGDLGALAELARSLGVLDGPDALAFLSSNAVTLAECCLVAARARELLDVVPVVGAMTLVATGGNPAAFDARVHAARPHGGQVRAAERMRELLAGASPAARHVQDPFGLRAFAQVLGPALELADELERVLEIELNAAAESPLIAYEAVLHNGNWHAMPVGLRLDALRLALQAVAALSASRLSNLMDPDLTGLRRFLAAGPDGSSGAMLLEYVAQDALAALRIHAQPATLGAVSLSQGIESHASFAPRAVTMTSELLGELRKVLACEVVAAGRAVALAGDQESLPRPSQLAGYLADVRDALPADLADRPLSPDLDAAEALLARWGAGEAHCAE